MTTHPFVFHCPTHKVLSRNKSNIYYNNTPNKHDNVVLPFIIYMPNAYRTKSCFNQYVYYMFPEKVYPSHHQLSIDVYRQRLPTTTSNENQFEYQLVSSREIETKQKQHPKKRLVSFTNIFYQKSVYSLSISLTN
jgi:hypothetical protein